MKKLLSLFTIGLFPVLLNAQERPLNIIFNQTVQAPPSAVANKPGFVTDLKMPSNSASRMTSRPGGSRYYIHAYYLQDILGLTLGGFFPYLWNDTTSMDSFTSAAGSAVYQYNNLTSVGLSFDPYVTSANNPAYFPGLIAVGPDDAYTIDTVLVGGTYQRSYATEAKRQVVDTLRIALVYGNGSATSDLPEHYFTSPAIHSDYATDTLYYIDMAHDSIHNIANGATVQHWDFIFDSSDTTTAAIYSFPVNFAVPANNFVSMSVTFISGDHTFTPFDTVTGITTGTGYKYGEFRPEVIYASNAAGDPLFPPYAAQDQNIGFFKQEGISDGGWGAPDYYTPQWANVSPGGASVYQYPNFGFHVHCSTCYLTTQLGVMSLANIKSVQATPDPANNNLNISFSLSRMAGTTVTLTNMLGEVVATQSMGSVMDGTATFNTTELPVGLYIYTFNANNEISTGKVAIVH